MQNFQDKDLDDFFRKSSENARLTLNPKAWENMEKKLAFARARKVFYRRVGYSLLLMLFVSGAFIGGNEFFFGNEPGKKIKPSVNSDQAETIAFSDGNRNRKTQDDVRNMGAEGVSKPTIKGGAQRTDGGKSEVVSDAARQESTINTTSVEKKSNKPALLFEPDSVDVSKQNDRNSYLPALSPRFRDFSSLYLNNHLEMTPLNANWPGLPIDEDKAKGKNREKLPKDLLRITFSVSPDVSSTFPFKNLQSGYNTGISMEYFILRNLSVSAGVFKSEKIYSTGPEAYNSGGYSSHYKDLEAVDGNCTVTDIPINMRFYYCEKTRLRAFAGVGVSNYLMRKETYVYEYSSYNQTYSYSKENNHLFSILNFSTGAEYRIGRNFSVGIEPFLKVATSGVGAGKIKLNSGGAFISVSYSLMKK